MSRNFSNAYTVEELEGLREIFRSLPTYNAASDLVSASDIPELIQKMGYPRTPEQVVAYQTYWERNFGGIVSIDDFITQASQLHETSKYAREYVLKVDADKDGFITSKEFEDLMELMGTHDPKLKSVSFEDFVHEADTNKDGKVSTDECVQWLEKNAAS